MSLLINLGEQIHRLIHLCSLSFQLKLIEPCFCALTCGLARRVIAVLIIGQHIFYILARRNSRISYELSVAKSFVWINYLVLVALVFVVLGCLDSYSA